MALSGWWHLACARRLLSRMDVDLLLVWNGEKAVNRAMVMAARENNIPVGFMEEGPLPGTTVLDPQGVHSQAVLPRDPAFYVQAGQNGKTVEATGIPHQPIWMMPWQPRSDSRLLTASPWIHSMAHAWQELLRARHRANCDDITLILERPSEGEAMPAGVEGQPGVQILDHADFMGRLPEASALFTVNSDLAMQAIGQGVRVVLMGDAFYEVPGLVLEAGGPESLVHAMKRLPVWSADPALVQGYLRYLQEDYLLPGDWRNPDINHWQAVITRLHKLARCEPIL
jgi:capsular polysaccharide export protein